MTQFIHLRTYSEYSIGLGSIKIKDLVKHCIKNEIPAVAITDKDNLFGSLEFSLEASKNGIKPIIGLNITIRHNKESSEVILLAQNEIGYKNLLKLSTLAYLEKKPHETPNINHNYLSEYNKGLLILTAGPGSLEQNLFVGNRQKEIRDIISNLLKIFKDRLYIEIYRTGSSTQKEIEYEEFILDIAYEKNIPIIATNNTRFLTSDMFEACDTLNCIANGRYLLEEDRPKVYPNMYFKSKKEMTELFHDLPEALSNTLTAAKRCNVMAQARSPLLPSFQINEPEDEYLTKMATHGLEKRIEHIIDPQKRKTYFDRLTYELSVIHKMKYSGYFLIVSDFIKWSKEQGIPVGPGRGSGAGSVVAWAIEITDLDPLQFGLLFERFLNPDRISMPDFDIDFCQERREEVINYVMEKYGKDRVAQIITFGKLQARAVLRDVGRVLHMPYNAIDRICKMVPINPANPVTLKEAINLDKELQKSRDNDSEIYKLLSISLQLEGLVRHASTHAAGIVIADRPIIEIVPLYKDEDSEMPAVQYSMKYAEEAGLVKFDFLGLKTLTVIAETCKLINNKQTQIDLSKLALNDKPTYDMLSTGNTIGIFQFESAGMKEAIKKLRPDKIEDIIALGSLYRPGPMDNIPSYINRKHGLEKAEYLHPLMENILRETYGIIVYQEQVIEIARVLAGYTLGAADLLRRAMGKKIKSEMEAQRQVFITGCIKNGINKDTADEAFALIEKFASYGFNKSHAAAYAIISYQTAYLKTHYPLELLIASLNSEIGDTDKINLFCQEAKRLNINILSPDINKSSATFMIEDNKIRYALGALKNVGTKAINDIIEERTNNGPFQDIFQLIERCGNKINKRMIESLAKSGALDSIHKNRNQLFTSSELLTKYASNHFSANTQQIGLFSSDTNSQALRINLPFIEDWNFQARLAAEFESCGFYLSAHPLEAYLSKLHKLHITTSLEVEAKATSKGTKLTTAGVITSKKIRSSKKGKYAFIQVSDHTGLIEVSIFSEELLYKYANLLEVGKILVFKIDARKDDTGLRIVVEGIKSIDDAIANIETALDIYIQDLQALSIIERNITTNSQGKKFNIILKIESGEEIFFSPKSTANQRITNNIVEELKKISGIKINEY